MKILIFGATGGTGLELVAQALAQSHTVIAFVRNPAALAARYRSGLDRSIRGKISRADVADFMLSQLIERTYLRQTPTLAY